MPSILRAALAALALVAGGAAPAAADDFLGSRTVAYLSEWDAIEVPGSTVYTAIRLCVADHAVQFTDLNVIYANGGHDDLPVRLVVPAGECTRWIDLRGGRRDVARVTMRYDTWGNAGPRATISVFGR